MESSDKSSGSPPLEANITRSFTEPINKTSSSDPPPSNLKPRKSSHSLLSASSSALQGNSRKGKHAEPDTVNTPTTRSSVSVPPIPLASMKSRTSSAASKSYSLSDGTPSPREDCAVEDADLPKHSGSSTFDFAKSSLPESTSRSQITSTDASKRAFVSSMFSLSSVRAGAIPSSAASANGSENGDQVQALCHLKTEYLRPKQLQCLS